MKPEIVILSAEVHSGKSEALMQWIQNKEEVSGLLCPVVDGKKRIFDISTKHMYPFEVELSPNTELVQIGKYSFLPSAFDQAALILEALWNKKSGLIIIDEIGKLELAGQGLEPALSKLFRQHAQSVLTFVLVVRDYLLDEVIRTYGFKEYKIIHPNDLKEL